jgi:predicted nucleotide-binding protein (sugar kinase/HSP70/actin superfamily)
VEGGRYGSIDPCYPSKVIQAHVHELLFHAHTDPQRRRGPLQYIFYPCITHIPTWVQNTMDNASCPIVAGSPNVIKAAFTKEVDFFAREGIEYIDKAVTFTEPHLLRDQLFEMWGHRLGVTRDESDWAVEEGFAALQAFKEHLERRGREIIEQVEREDRIAILMIGRPYHSDPGLNHGIPEEFQVLGYPILSVRSIPTDRAWLQRYFGKDDPLDINDVWPENYSANSVQKVWAARFAARHPNIAVLDLSSFKCGHDAPTYGMIDNIVSATKTPYSALHDIDANKPGGSIAIRVKTYAHKLKLVEEQLRETSAARAELARRVAEKRRELLARYQAQSPATAK